MSWRPITPPRNPPSVVPTGIVPHEMKRIVAFTRPRIRAGVIAWRRLTALTFQRTPKNDSATIVVVSPANEQRVRGERDRQPRHALAHRREDDHRPDAEDPRHRLAIRAPAMTPTDPIVNARPIRAGANRAR